MLASKHLPSAAVEDLDDPGEQVFEENQELAGEDSDDDADDPDEEYDDLEEESGPGIIRAGRSGTTDRAAQSDLAREEDLPTFLSLRGQ